eukprot:3920584-Rhodomonas_salina.1
MWFLVLDFGLIPKSAVYQRCISYATGLRGTDCARLHVTRPNCTTSRTTPSSKEAFSSTSASAGTCSASCGSSRRACPLDSPTGFTSRYLLHYLLHYPLHHPLHYPLHYLLPHALVLTSAPSATSTTLVRPAIGPEGRFAPAGVTHEAGGKVRYILI